MNIISAYKNLTVENKQNIIVISALFLLICYILHYIITKDFFERNSASTPTAENVKFTSDLQEVRLRPFADHVFVPANHLWYIHKNRITSGCGQYDIPHVGKMWNRIDVRFLLPNFDARTKENEKLFWDNDGKNLIQITFFKSKGCDGDVRYHWAIINGFIGKVGIHQVESFNNNKPLDVFKKHSDLKLNEYKWDEKWFKSDSGIVMKCWNAMPFSHFSYQCDSSYSPLHGITVNYSFHIEKLSEWEKINNFVHKTVNSYLDAGRVMPEK